MNKIFFLCMLLFSLCGLATATPSVPAASSAPASTKFDFRGVNVASVVQLVYAEALHESYVIDPEVLTDPRTVSFRFEGNKHDLSAFVTAFFDSLGLIVTRRGRIDFVSKKPPPIVAPGTESEVFIYRPRFRDGAYLVELLAPLVSGSFTSKRAVHGSIVGDSAGTDKVAPVGSAAASVDRQTDTVVFTGSSEDVAKLKSVLPQVDLPVGDVLVRGVLYEVQTDEKDGSAFGLALNLLRGSTKLGVGPLTTSPGAAFVALKNNSIEAIFSVLSQDSRFKAVSRPMLRVTSGGAGRFTVGQDVPVLGSVSYPGAGQAPVQSVTYQSSGVIYDIRPVVHDASIEVSVMQQTSNFVATNTGVSGSPTLIKRELKSNLSLTDGEIAVMGGLRDSKEARSSEGLSLLPTFLRTKFGDKTGVEILLILQVTKL
jgi:general secretion pathway protein D